MSKANGSGGEDLQAAFNLEEDAPLPSPNGGGSSAEAGKVVKRGKRISAAQAAPAKQQSEAPAKQPAEAPAPAKAKRESGKPNAAKPTPAAKTAKAKPEAGKPAAKAAPATGRPEAAPPAVDPAKAAQPKAAPPETAPPAASADAPLPEAPDESADEAAAPEAAEETAPQGPRVMRYVNEADGCWRELEDGTREPLSDAEWVNALARHFKRGDRATG